MTRHLHHDHYENIPDIIPGSDESIVGTCSKCGKTIYKGSLYYTDEVDSSRIYCSKCVLTNRGEHRYEL